MTSLAALAVALFAAAPVPAHTTVVVAAAANLKAAAVELKQAFEAGRPDVEVALTFGASGTLFAQAQNGAPFDLFLSADREFPARLIAAGLAAAADERTYAFGQLVAWLPPGSTIDLEHRGLVALASPEVKRIAIANPAVAPFGRVAMTVLERAGVAAAVKEKLVLGTSVAQAAQFASTGAAEVALLPRSLTLGPGLREGRVVPIGESLAPPIAQSGLVLAGAREPVLARAFLDFLTGEKGRAILVTYGYGLP